MVLSFVVGTQEPGAVEVFFASVAVYVPWAVPEVLLEGPWSLEVLVAITAEVMSVGFRFVLSEGTVASKLSLTRLAVVHSDHVCLS